MSLKYIRYTSAVDLFPFPLPNLSYNGLREPCYHGDILTPLASATFSASTAALVRILAASRTFHLL